MAEQPAPNETPPDETPLEATPPPPAPAAQAPQPEPVVDPAPVEASAPVEATAPVEAAVPVAAAAVTAEQQAALDDAGVSQESIDALLKEANFDTPDADAGETAAGPSIEELLQQANFEDAASGATPPPGGDAEAFKLPSFQQVLADAQVSSIDLLRDVELNVKIELGRSRMLVEEVLQLAEGSVVELDKLAGDPVDVFVNDRLVARGEVLVLNENFCVRVNEIVPAAQEEAL